MAMHAPIAERIALVGSSGGHLTHLLALRPLWEGVDRFWVTFPTDDAIERLVGERVYWCHYPTNRHVRNLARNTILAARLLVSEQPDLIISTGAAVAVPFAYLARFRATRFVFIEVVDRVSSATMTGRLVAPVASVMAVQLDEQARLYRGAAVIGRVI